MCLNEPTNYLNLESPATLIEALSRFSKEVYSLSSPTETSSTEIYAIRYRHLEASGHNWIKGQGAGPCINKAAFEEDTYNAMGNKIDTKKQKKISASEARKLKERMARKRRGEEITDDEL